MASFSLDPFEKAAGPRISGQRRGTSWSGRLTAACIVVAAGVWMLRSGGIIAGPGPNPQREVTPRGPLDAEERTTIDVFKSASPSVAYITSLTLARNMFTWNLLEIPQGTGSGFVYDELGHVVTNFHVIEHSNSREVVLADHSRWKAEVVGVAPDKDLAVIKIDAPRDRLKPIAIGTSADLQVGQKVLAIGNPFGFDYTLTTGVVSALGREIESFNERTIQDVIQTDAAINPGNSGGPLLDSAGRLIGVNTQIASPSGASAGIGFAVPVDTVNKIVAQLIRFGHVIRPDLGVELVSDHLARQIGIQKGVLIDFVPRNSAAGEAGLRGTQARRDRKYVQIERLGDVIIGVGSHPVEDQNDLLNALEKYDIGDDVVITYRRSEETLQATIKLEAVKS